MSKRTCVPVTLATATTLLLAALAVAGPLDQPTVESSRLVTYAKPSGDSYFALSLTPAIQAKSAPSYDVVVLFDTSASQSGAYRQKALESLRSLVASLADEDRVQLMAVDLDATPMTSGFVAPRSPEMNKGLEKLTARVPLGSTDMAQVLNRTMETFSSRTAPRAAVYIGDGMSNANLALFQQMDKLIADLVKARVPVSSLIIGPENDVQLMSVFANHTGGIYPVDGEKVGGKEGGLALANAARAVVAWPTSVTWPKEFGLVLPTNAPPLRSDRDSILIGKGNPSSALDVQIAAEVAGQPARLQWKVTPEASSKENAFLSSLVDAAQPDNGLSLPTAGSDALLEVRRMILASVETLRNLGGQSLAVGNRDQAQKLITEALRRDPGDVDAQAMMKNLTGAPANVNTKASSLPATQQDQQMADERTVPPPPPGNEASAALLDEFSGPKPSGSFLESAQQERELTLQIEQSLVRTELEKARGLMSREPAKVVTDMKLLLDRVLRVPELSAELRTQLRGQIEAVLRQAEQQVVEKENRDLELQQKIAVQNDVQRALAELDRKEERRQQLQERVNALLDEALTLPGRQGLERNAQAIQIADEGKLLNVAWPEHGNVMANNSVKFTNLDAAYREMTYVRDLRYKGFLDTMSTVEWSHIPFRDDTPIVYPARDEWERITAARKKFASTDFKKRGAAEERILNEFEKPTQFEFTETPLADAINYIKEKHEIEIQFDNKALTDLGITTDRPVTKTLRGISLRSALRLLLRDLDLTYVIRDEVLLITTPDEANKTLVVKVYPVGDLVLPIPQDENNPFGWNSNLPNITAGGSSGGSGGGMQGGGVGGQGGAGGAGGGGAAFSVPDEALTPGPIEGPAAFAVPDELKMSSKKNEVAKPATATAPATVAPAAKPAAKAPVEAPVVVKGQRIHPAAQAGADREAIWDAHFAAHQESPENLRETARLLMQEKNYGDATAMIRMALRSGQGQPWMYETLGLALELGGQPVAEVERALMSAVDFSRDPNELMYIALYFAKLDNGLQARALKLFQQVSASNPTRTEPYLYGLRLAERLNDIPALQWACAGVLSQAWPRDKQEFANTASRIATATLERLRADGRTQEAVAFQAKLDQAALKDCVVKVTWTGDADVDIMVEEPSGVVCSVANPRTTGGGVLLGDTFARDHHTAEAYSESYVCPQGFTGDYKLMLRRVWGQVTSGTVTVDIETHVGKEVSHFTQEIPLTDKDALVNFRVAEGRRTEPLVQQQVAQAAVNQMNTNQAILAQQLSDTSAASSFSESRQIPFVTGAIPVIGGSGQVGFQPIVSTFPDGTTMRAHAVISSDRRYVRISVIPIFQTLVEVSTFNTSQAVNTNSNTNNGGGNTGGTGAGGGAGT